MDDVARIAKGLTKIERALFARFSADAEDADEIVHIQTDEEARALQSLLHKGAMAFIRAVFVFAQLTETGLAVRRYLQENPDAG